MIGFVEAVEGRPVDAEQRTLPVRLLEAVEIDQQAHDAIAEAMADRLQACMHHFAEIKRGRGVFGVAIGLGFGGWLSASLLRGLCQFGRRCAPRHGRAERLGDRKPGPQSVLVKAVSGPGAAEPGVTPALNLGQLLLGGESRGVILRMIAGIFAERQRRIRFETAG